MELTKEQIEAARQHWECPSSSLEKALNAVAPYVQLPWKYPTINEVYEFHHNDAFFRELRFVQCLDGLSLGGRIHLALVNFINRRNAALLPSPIDPRLKRVADIIEEDESLNKTFATRANAERLAALILAGIDGTK